LDKVLCLWRFYLFPFPHFYQNQQLSNTMNELFTPEKGMTFLSMNDSREFSIAYSGQHNYAMVTQDSNTIKGYIRMECKRHREYRKAKGKVNETPDENSGSVVKKEKRNGKTWRMNCPAFMFFKRGDKSTWTLKEMELKHTHPPAGSLSTFAIYRRLTDEQRAQVHKLVDAKAPPRVIVDYMNSNGCHMVAKDVANFRARFSDLDENNNSNLTLLFNHLEANGYVVRTALDDQSQIAAMFFTHDKCIRLAQSFNEVVLVDATYRTNKSQFPLVNLVGVNNVGCDDKTLSTFGIAGAWICNEDGNSYNWVMQCLLDVVYTDEKRQPGIFVTDQQKALMNAINIVFPESHHMLCYLHLFKNFEKHVSKKFTDDKKWHKAGKLFKSISRSVDQASFDSAYLSLKELAESFCSDKGIAVNAFLER
jgi:hypothetical protein